MSQQSLTDRTDDVVLAQGDTVISVAQAKGLVKLFADVTTSQEVDSFVSGFTEDCVIRFNCFPELNGTAELRSFMARLFAADRPSFHCKKTLRSISGNVLGVEWHSTWFDPKTKSKMETRGSEFWIMNGEKIARWDAVSTNADRQAA